MDKKNIMNEHNFNYSIKERIQNRKEWVNYFSECLKHNDITSKVSKEFYEDKPILSFVFKLYFLPMNLYRYFYNLRMKHYYFKWKKEVEILERELNDGEGYFYFGRWYPGKKNEK